MGKNIIYCDAGFITEGKNSGWGVHIYSFLDEVPKKGTGDAKVIPTSEGYRHVNNKCTEDAAKVTVTKYTDLFGGMTTAVCNNQAELTALQKSLEWVLATPEVTDVIIYSDSRYVVVGSNDWLHKWKTNGWRNASGDLIKYREHWESVGKLLESVKARLSSFSLRHLNGHDGDPGNEKSHYLACNGITASYKNLPDYMTVKDPTGYWNPKCDAPRIIRAPRWYFATKDENFIIDHPVTKTPVRVYYTGVHGTKDKETELVGKPYADNVLMVSFIHEPEPVLEDMRQIMIDNDKTTNGMFLVSYLDNIFSPKIYNVLKEHGCTYFAKKGDRADLITHAKTPILEELKPIGLAFRQEELWKLLQEILTSVLTETGSYVVTDITDILFDDDEKDKRKLKSCFPVVCKYTDVKVKFNLRNSQEPPEETIGKIRLIFGSDILSRNALAALAPDVKRVSVVTWRESPTMARYTTLVELNDGDVTMIGRPDANIFYRKES